MQAADDLRGEFPGWRVTVRQDSGCPRVWWVEAVAPDGLEGAFVSFGVNPSGL